MLATQTIEKLHAMRLAGMAQAYREQREHTAIADLSFDERFGILVERQWLYREDQALTLRLKGAHLGQPACIEGIDFRHPRGLKRATIDQMASCEWILHHKNCLITGPTGSGKSYLACALANKACREGYKARYYYLPKLFRELAIANADGSLGSLITKLSKIDLLAMDDWGLASVLPDYYRIFLEILDDRQDKGATLLTSQYPVANWHELVGDQTIADAILDRLVHNAFKIELEGESLRRLRPHEAG